MSARTVSTRAAAKLGRSGPLSVPAETARDNGVAQLFALDAGDAAAAIQSLQPAMRFDIAFGNIGFSAYYGTLYRIYVRGLACLPAKQPSEAAAEFQRILDHHSIMLVDPVGGRS